VNDREKMVSGEWYVPDLPQLVEDRRRASAIVRAFNAEEDEAARTEHLRELVGSLGEAVEITPPLRCDYGYNVSVGDRVFINYDACFLDCAPVTIGDDVQIGPGVQFLTPHHPIDPEMRRGRVERAAPIAIGDNVWIGGGALLIGGVTIGPDTVIGAGSVVTRDIPAGVVAVGAPCRVLREV
jgi:maltose O-acetyltransferase